MSLQAPNAASRHRAVSMNSSSSSGSDSDVEDNELQRQQQPPQQRQAVQSMPAPPAPPPAPRQRVQPAVSEPVPRPPRMPNAFVSASSSSSSSASTGGGGSSSKRSHKKLKRWFRACRKKHLKEMTPEVKQRMVQNAKRQERERKVWQKVRKAKKMEYASKACRSATMKSFAAQSRRASNLNSVGLRAGSSAQERQSVQLAATAMLSKTSRVLHSRCSSSESEDDIAALEVEGAMEEQAMGGAQIEGVIDELRREPKSDSEVAAKFQVYENYLATVEESRKQCLGFHAKCKTDLHEHPPILRKMAAAIASIDSDENKSINWDALGGRWFVYDMTKKSDSNNAFIGKVFSGLKRDLEMVSNNDMDCPICLENLTQCPSGIRVLRCCHKLCGDCYDNWKETCTGGRVICPMCRAQDFQEVIVTRRNVQGFLQTMASESSGGEESSAEEEGGGRNGGGGGEDVGRLSAFLPPPPPPAPAPNNNHNSSNNNNGNLLLVVPRPPAPPPAPNNNNNNNNNRMAPPPPPGPVVNPVRGNVRRVMK